MTFVYVIVSSPRDYIVEQAMISMHSLRMYNPEAYITAVMDSNTEKGLIGNRGRINEYIDKIISLEVPKRLNSTQKSRFLKTSLRRLIEGDFLYLDSDTVVTDTLAEINQMQCDVAQTLNMHCENCDRDNPDPMINGYMSITGKDILKEMDINRYYNSGVIYCKDTEIAHEFFNRWHQLWLRDSLELGFHKDQVAEWVANYELGNMIQDLDPKYNCQFVFAVYALKHFESAKVLHYISTTTLGSCLKFTDKTFLKKISKYGIEDEDEQYIKDIKTIFLNKLHIITDKALRNYLVEETTLEIIAKKISFQFPWVNNLISYFINLVKRK